MTEEGTQAFLDRLMQAAGDANISFNSRHTIEEAAFLIQALTKALAEAEREKEIAQEALRDLSTGLDRLHDQLKVKPEGNAKAHEAIRAVQTQLSP